MASGGRGWTSAHQQQAKAAWTSPQRRRMARSDLKTSWSPLELAESESALARKTAAISEPEWRFYGEHMVIGGPAQAVAHVQRLVDASFQYVIVHTRADLDTARILADHVLPALGPPPAPAVIDG